MRALLFIGFAALAGVACGGAGELDAPFGESEEEVSGGSARAERGGGRQADSDADSDPRWVVLPEGLPPTLFTSTVRGDGNAMYATGTFAGWLTVGRDTLKSRGSDDVVLVRFDADGKIAWARAIGSTRTERAPHVTFSDGKVRILAETDGEVDCGSGDMGLWSSGMFFYCLYDEDGGALGGGTFPTGKP